MYDDYTTIFAETRHENRYLSIFTPAYFAANDLNGSRDYNQFYPSTPWSPNANVMGAQILTADIYAANGVVHETDQVIETPKNLDEMIMQYAEDPTKASEGWAEFKALLKHQYADGTNQFITYTENKEAATYYRKMYPELESQIGRASCMERVSSPV